MTIYPNEFKIIDLIFINLLFWIIFFFPLLSIVDRKKESLEKTTKIICRKYQGIRFLITVYLLLMLGLLAYLALPTISSHKTSNILVVAPIVIVLLRIMTFNSRDYEN